MKKVIVIMAVLACSLPVEAEILVFATSTSGQQFDIPGKKLEAKAEHGYMVLDVSLADVNNIVVNGAYHLHYEKKAGVKVQNTTIFDSNDVELTLVDLGKTKRMVLQYFDSEDEAYKVVYGTARLTTIGGGLQRYVPGSLSGHGVWKQQDFRTGSGQLVLRLSITATRTANDQHASATDIIDAYEQTLLTKSGYSPE